MLGLELCEESSAELVMPIAIKKNYAYNPLNISFLGYMNGFLIPIFSSSYQDCLQVCPSRCDRNCPPPVLLCSDILSVNPDRACGHLIPDF
ncbi:hypothetical protein [Microcoleus sp. F4-D5]|uniref:hypothetical protein n=1 Tax=Microcoleus sp. F4-D5 TaxID=2818760 RepID=UPI002FCFB249